jgi:hypothetical protein
MSERHPDPEPQPTPPWPGLPDDSPSEDETEDDTEDEPQDEPEDEPEDEDEKDQLRSLNLCPVSPDPSPEATRSQGTARRAPKAN